MHQVADINSGAAASAPFQHKQQVSSPERLNNQTSAPAALSLGSPFGSQNFSPQLTTMRLALPPPPVFSQPSSLSTMKADDLTTQYGTSTTKARKTQHESTREWSVGLNFSEDSRPSRIEGSPERLSHAEFYFVHEGLDLFSRLERLIAYMLQNSGETGVILGIAKDMQWCCQVKCIGV